MPNCHNVTGWVSVGDRMPEVERKKYPSRIGCLVVADASKPTVMFMEYERTFVRAKEVFRWKWNDRISTWNVTHWMPLPEPPRGVVDHETD